MDLNATQAYLRAYPRVRTSTAGANGHELLKKTDIRQYVQELMHERAALIGITAECVLVRLWQMATADSRELVEVVVGCCRHCWGENNRYQYTETEWENVLHAHLQAERKRAIVEKDYFVRRECPIKGGIGFDPRREPNAECTECFGNGSPQTVIKDTRKLSAGAAMLFAGVKTDKHGQPQVQIRDPLPALLKVGEHLGLFNDKLAKPDETDPLTALLQQIHGNSGTGSTLPVVGDDPERIRPVSPDVQDVRVRWANDPKPRPRQQWRRA